MRRWWTRWKRRENESTEIYCQFKAVVRYYVLIDWVGGPNGKVFGSRLWRTDRAQRRGPSAMTESQIFPVRPDSVNKHFIVWLISLKEDAIDWHARNNHKNDPTIKTFPFCFRVRTGNSHFIEKRDICFRFCLLLSLIFWHNSGRCFSILYFLYKCTGAGWLFPDRKSVSWGFPNGPVKLFCSPSRWRFQKFWSLILPYCFPVPKKVAFEIFPRTVTVTGHFEKRVPAHINPSGPTQVSFH